MTVVSVDWLRGFSPRIHVIIVTADPVCQVHTHRFCMTDNEGWIGWYNWDLVEGAFAQVSGQMDAAAKQAQAAALHFRLLQKEWENHRLIELEQAILRHEMLLALEREEGDLLAEIPSSPGVFAQTTACSRGPPTSRRTNGSSRHLLPTARLPSGPAGTEVPGRPLCSQRTSSRSPS